MESNNEDETDELMNDSDTESIVPKEIELTANLDNASVLTPEANVYVHELETNKKKKSRKKISRSHGKVTFLHILKKIIFLRADIPLNLAKVLQISISMNKLIIFLFNKATSIPNKTRRTFSPMRRK